MRTTSNLLSQCTELYEILDNFIKIAHTHFFSFSLFFLFLSLCISVSLFLYLILKFLTGFFVVVSLHIYTCSNKYMLYVSCVSVHLLLLFVLTSRCRFVRRVICIASKHHTIKILYACNQTLLLTLTLSDWQLFW